MSFQKLLRQHVVAFLLVVLALAAQIDGIGEVIWAVNCGGEAHVDVHGIRYQKDTLDVGTPSDYGKSLVIQRVVPQDQILYQTERYSMSNFGYDIPLRQDGDYVLVLQFSEVWFTAPNQKVFDVQLNGEHTVVESLDIFGKVGRGAAHDEIIPFTVKKGKLKVGDETSVVGDKLKVEFIKGPQDNPKVNAIYVMRGRVDDVPQLAPQMQGTDHKEEEEEEDEIDEEMKREKRRRHASGPKVQDPYAADDTGSMMLPVFVAIGAFIPVLFCLCKL